MLLKLTLLPSDAIVDPLEPADRQRRVAPLDATSSYPPLHFVGEISSVIQMRGAPERAVKGTVQLTKEGDVWWKFVISYDGESQWILYAFVFRFSLVFLPSIFFVAELTSILYEIDDLGTEFKWVVFDHDTVSSAHGQQ